MPALEHALAARRDVVLDDGAGHAWSGADLLVRVRGYEAQLRAREQPRAPVGLLADNSPDWIAIDLAARRAGVTVIPLPEFFSRAQMAHVARVSGMQSIYCADPAPASALGFEPADGRRSDQRLHRYRRRDPAAPPESGPAPACIHKITFTSGTTGTPKGVCLTFAQQWHVAQALAERTAALGLRRHLNLLPLAVLLENVAGVYAPLAMGAACVCPPSHVVGLTGSAAFDADRCLHAIARHRPDSVILLPQMLKALLGALRANDARVESLKFVAVGGAKTPAEVIIEARALGLPVYEGYGLSECCSVVSLNRPSEDKPGTVGKALPGVALRIGAGGEIEVRGRFHGYLGQPPRTPGDWFQTGDLGTIDTEGYLTVRGRRDNVLITSFGRNVAPEWPEALLQADAAIAQAAVFGAARPVLAAVLVPAHPNVGHAAIDRAVARVNRTLPDYARIGHWIRADEPFQVRNQLATANGRVRRDRVWAHYAARIDALYRNHDTVTTDPTP